MNQEQEISMIDYDVNDPIIKMLERLPFVIDWVEYKGETYVAQNIYL